MLPLMPLPMKSTWTISHLFNTALVLYVETPPHHLYFAFFQQKWHKSPILLFIKHSVKRRTKTISTR